MNKFRFGIQQTVAKTAVAMAVASVVSVSSLAAENPLTKITYDATQGKNVIDLVMSIDWDFDAPPAGRDKAFIEGILRQAAQSYYTMTEGRHLIGKVYIYKNSQFMNNTDIQYLQRDGRANAHINGINGCRPCRNEMFAGTNEGTDAHGKTVAHEFGHYILGLYDEYREVGGTSTDPGFPQDGDTARDSIMHNHLQFLNVSTATDYVDTANRKTAQWRMYGKSAWEALVSDPSGDNTSRGGPARVFFESFRNLTPPTGTTLTRPTTGWESSLKVVYMGGTDVPASAQRDGTFAADTPGPINVLVLDTTSSTAHLNAQINAAIQIVNTAAANNRIAVIAHPFSSTPLVPLTRLTTASARSSVKASISVLKAASATDDATLANRLFDWAETVLPAVFPAGPKSATGSGYTYRIYSTGQALGIKDGRVYYYNGSGLSDLGAASPFLTQASQSLSTSMQKALSIITAVRMDSDSPTVTLMTSATQNVDASVGNAFKEARVPVYPVALITERAANRFAAVDSGSLSLYELANTTKGLFQEASKAGDLTRAAGKSSNDAEGDVFQGVNEDGAEQLASGASHTMRSLVAGGSLDSEVLFEAFWSDDDEGKISFSLISPSGTSVSPTSLPAGVTYTANTGEGTASYKVTSAFGPGLGGTWTSTIRASSATTEAVYQEVTAKSDLSSQIDVFGGTSSDTRPATAILVLRAPEMVKGASVVAEVRSADTDSLVANPVFRDNGQTPDLKAGDGIYTADLSGLPVGDYEIIARATGDGTAVMTTAATPKMGTNKPDVALPAFQRIATKTFRKER